MRYININAPNKIRDRITFIDVRFRCLNPTYKISDRTTEVGEAVSYIPQLRSLCPQSVSMTIDVDPLYMD